MRTSLDPEGLRREMVKRAVNGAELAVLAGVTGATVSHALSGRRVSDTTIRALARALTLTPVVPLIAAIIPTKTETVATSTAATVSTEAQRVFDAETPV